MGLIVNLDGVPCEEISEKIKLGRLEIETGRRRWVPNVVRGDRYLPENVRQEHVGALDVYALSVPKGAEANEALYGLVAGVGAEASETYYEDSTLHSVDFVARINLDPFHKLTAQPPNEKYNAEGRIWIPHYFIKDIKAHVVLGCEVNRGGVLDLEAQEMLRSGWEIMLTDVAKTILAMNVEELVEVTRFFLPGTPEYDALNTHRGLPL